MDEEALKALIEFLTHDVPDAYSNKGCLLRKYRNGHENELGSGAARVVIMQEFGGIKVAIKFVFNYRMDDNLKEWRAWHVMPSGVREMTAKPYAISTCNRAIAFEYVPQTTREFLGDRIIDRRVAEFNKKLRRLFEEAGYDSRKIDQLLRDNKPDNIGIRSDGSLVWIDFASYL